MKRTLCLAVLLSSIGTFSSTQAQTPAPGVSGAAVQPGTERVPEPPTGNQPTIPPGGFPPEIPANAPLQGGHSTAGPSTVASADLAFLDEVAKSTSAEAMASTMELQHTKNAEMESFAKQLLADSSEISQTLKPLAASKRISLPANMADDDRSKLQNMHELDPQAMDREYTRLYGPYTQQKLLDLFDRTANAAKDGDVRAFASNNLSKLKRDLEAAQRLPST